MSGIKLLVIFLLYIFVFGCSTNKQIKQYPLKDKGLTISDKKTHSKHQFTEKEYQIKWCNKKDGIIEYVLDDKARVDCLLPNMAVEFDFASKWAECIGQALYYGKKTNRNPACVLIMEQPKRDTKYLNRLLYTVKQFPNFKIFTVNQSLLDNI